LTSNPELSDKQRHRKHLEGRDIHDHNSDGNGDESGDSYDYRQKLSNLTKYQFSSISSDLPLPPTRTPSATHPEHRVVESLNIALNALSRMEILTPRPPHPSPPVKDVAEPDGTVDGSVSLEGEDTVSWQREDVLLFQVTRDSLSLDL
jgi:hypothetical protein